MQYPNNQYPNPYGQFSNGLRETMVNFQQQGQYLQQGVYPSQSNPQLSGNPMMGAVGQPMPGIRNSQPLQPVMFPNSVSNPTSMGQVGGATTCNIPTPISMQMGMPYQQPNHLYPSIRKNSNNTIPFQGAMSINKPKYDIPSNQKEKYANIYALLYTIDELQYCYCSGNVPKADYDERIDNLCKQFETARNPLNLSNDDIERFTQAFDMNVSYALDVIKNPLRLSSSSVGAPTAPSTDNSPTAVFFALGMNFITLSDLCVMEGIEASQFQNLLKNMRGRFQNIGLYQSNPKVKEYTDKWIDTFSKFKPTDVISKDIKDQLQADIVPWKELLN